MKRLGYILFAWIVLTVMSGCRSSRHAQRTTDINVGATPQVVTPSESVTTPSGSDHAEESDETDASKKSKKRKKQQEETTTVVGKTNAKALSAKMNLTLEAGSKKVNLGGTYRLKRNEVIQLNLTYTMLVTVNIGTIELTPACMLVVDRWNKRYCRVTYEEISALAQKKINFDYLQRVFWGESNDSPSEALTWSYADWMKLGDGQFPSRIQFNVRTKDINYRASFRLSNLRETTDWTTYTEVGSRYTFIPLNSILKALMSAGQ